MIGVVAGIFVGSGAIGYVLASIYHPLYWWLPCFSRDRLLFLRKLISSDKLKIRNISGSEIKACDLNKRDAWTILTYYWYANIDASKEPAGLSKITDRLTDF
jgi:hypothetical protein